jgi:arylformamidase
MAHNEWNKAEILMPEKGPKVFLDYDQAALDAAYDQAAYAPSREQQVCRAVAWVYRNAARFDGDPNRLYIGGQSSGGHLAAVALTTDWQCDFGLPADIIKGGMCISGMYDLTPVRLSARSRYVAFDDATVAALSPLQHLDQLHAPLLVAYGTCETPEFQRQNREFAAAVEASGKAVELLVGEHYNHFELPETLGNPYGLLGRAALDFMGLASVSP